MNLSRYDVFRAIAEAGGISAAALELKRTPAAVHYQLRQLEASLDRKLFVRVGRRLQMTPVGRVLLEGVTGGLAQIRRVEERLLDEGEAVPLRVMAVSGFGRYRLAPRLLRELPAQRRLQLVFGTHEQTVEAVRHGQADLGITYRGVVTTPIEAVPLALEDLALLAPAAMAGRPLADLLGERFITYDEYDYVYARWFESALGRQPASLRRGDHFGELEEAMESAAFGRGLVIVPADAWQTGCWAGRLAIPAQAPVASNTIFLIGPPGTIDGADAQLLRRASRA
jgi:DNA-binding transcriptional LysR family regulator